MTKHKVTSLTTHRVHVGTRQAVSLHQRNAAEDETEMTEICAMSYVVEMHAAGSKTDVRSMSTLNRRSMKKGTITVAPTIYKNKILTT
jgi:hypothetical protein